MTNFCNLSSPSTAEASQIETIALKRGIDVADYSRVALLKEPIVHLFSKTLMTAFILLIPALSQANTSISCAVGQEVGTSKSIGVNVNIGARSNYIILNGNKVSQGNFATSRVDYLNVDSMNPAVFTLENKATGVSMAVFSEDYQQNTAGIYAGEAKIKVAAVETKGSEITYCTIIVDHKQN